MDKPITTLLQGLRLSEPVHSAGLTFVPVICDMPLGPEYVTLAEAVAAKTLKVTEVNEGGSVPNLVARNVGDVAVLILDGEELAGAKQNRVLNTTVLIGAGKSYTIPVSCVEHGRWSYVSAEFRDSGHHATHRIRSKSHANVAQSVRSVGVYDANQSEVWDDVAAFSLRQGVSSPTGAMRDVYEQRAAQIERSVAEVPPVDGQNGLLVMYGDRVLGLDVVSRPAAYTHVHRKLVQSYVADVPDDKAVSGEQALSAAKAFVASLGELVGTDHESPGMGRSHQYTSEGVVGSALTYRDAVIHAAFFSAEPKRAEMNWPGQGRQGGIPPILDGGW